MHWYGIFWPTATQITYSHTNTQALQLAFFLNHIMEPNYTWPAFPLCIRYYFARLLLLSYRPSLGLFYTSTYTNRHAVQSNIPDTPEQQQQYHRYNNIISCMHLSCMPVPLYKFNPSNHPSVGRPVCLLGLSTVLLLLLLLIQSHRPQRGASSLLVILLLCEPHSKEEYRRHDDDWRMSRRRC